MALGFPLEYFDAVNLAILAKRLPEFSLSNPSSLFHVRTSPNGLISFKLSNTLAETDKDSLLSYLNTQYFLVIDYQDQDAQARSLAIAMQTKRWVQLKGEKPLEIPQITEYSILKAKSILDNERAMIRKYISKRNISPLYINHEGLIANPKIVIDQICNFLNIKICQEVDINKIPINKQS